MRRVSEALFAVGLVGTFSSAAAQTFPSEVEFARKEFGNWELRAVTSVKWSRPHPDTGYRRPSVGNIFCLGDSPDITFQISQAGQVASLYLTFLGAPDEEDERDQPTLTGDHLWLEIDGKRWEFANIPQPSANFNNLEYPPTPDGEIVIPIWRGYRALRAKENGRWVNFSRFYETIISAQKLSWGFKSRDWKVVDKSIAENRLPDGWQRHKYVIRNQGLKEAVDWCTDKVQSDTARAFPEKYFNLLKTNDAQKN